ncbi:3-hydroxyacyl-ACP dehydratase FabZ family protein [Spongiivirga citrea]|uniref:Hydroxymyristoyl-ACP dehydratase n=1 Tax=Spongiivirga citrea TaxID=1481457 RepID=A0A6M0CDY6_9FLAO|nr:hydroxymyristoyl-ACP dehydratase [Spongiivirga citrea]NER15622.1 hydroxymyristoyl-ACP dehydratase [Spongiivirga citrea]
MSAQEIISKLPYSDPFLFVDELSSISENEITGSYLFKRNMPFYDGHFKGNPITPGVILTECMAQIGVVCLGIFLMGDKLGENPKIAMTSTDIHFLNPVLPDEKVIVTSTKEYFRFGKLKCHVTMTNEEGEEVCNGFISGMIFQ